MDAADRVKARYAGPMVWLGVYLSCLIGAAAWTAFYNYRIQHPFNIGDWLINYSGGFVRRGLIGSIVLSTSKLVHQPPGLVVVVLDFVLCTVLYVAFWFLARPLRWRPWSVALVLSPATLGFMMLNGGGASRKDILFLLMLSFLLLQLRKGISDRGVVLYLSAAAVLLTLSHEGLVVYWPYLLAAVAISRESFWKSVRLGIAPSIVLAGLTFLVSRYPGNLSQVNQICSSIGDVYTELGAGLCGGSIAYLAKDTSYYRFQVVNSIRTNHYLRDYGVVIFLASLPYLIGIRKMWQTPSSRSAIQHLLPWTAGSIVFSLLLFVFAVDWGRWIYIHFFSMMLLLLFISTRFDQSDARSTWDWPHGTRGVVASVLIAVYLVFWHLPPTGYEQRGWGYIGMARRHLQRGFH